MASICVKSTMIIGVDTAGGGFGVAWEGAATTALGASCVFQKSSSPSLVLSSLCGGSFLVGITSSSMPHSSDPSDSSSAMIPELSKARTGVGLYFASPYLSASNFRSIQLYLIPCERLPSIVVFTRHLGALEPLIALALRC